MWPSLMTKECTYHRTSPQGADTNIRTIGGSISSLYVEVGSLCQWHVLVPIGAWVTSIIGQILTLREHTPLLPLFSPRFIEDELVWTRTLLVRPFTLNYIRTTSASFFLEKIILLESPLVAKRFPSSSTSPTF